MKGESIGSILAAPLHTYMCILNITTVFVVDVTVDHTGNICQRRRIQMCNQYNFISRYVESELQRFELSVYAWFYCRDFRHRTYCALGYVPYKEYK